MGKTHPAGAAARGMFPHRLSERAGPAHPGQLVLQAVRHLRSQMVSDIWLSRSDRGATRRHSGNG